MITREMPIAKDAEARPDVKNWVDDRWAVAWHRIAGLVWRMGWWAEEEASAVRGRTGGFLPGTSTAARLGAIHADLDASGGDGV
jgi:hypothetical protein